MPMNEIVFHGFQSLHGSILLLALDKEKSYHLSSQPLSHFAVLLQRNRKSLIIHFFENCYVGFLKYYLS